MLADAAFLQLVSVMKLKVPKFHDLHDPYIEAPKPKASQTEVVNALSASNLTIILPTVLLLLCVTVICVNYSLAAVLINITPDLEKDLEEVKEYSIFSVENDVWTFVATLLSAIATIGILVFFLIANFLLNDKDIRIRIKIICAFAPIGLTLIWVVVTIIYITRKSRLV